MVETQHDRRQTLSQQRIKTPEKRYLCRRNSAEFIEHQMSIYQQSPPQVTNHFFRQLIVSRNASASERLSRRLELFARHFSKPNRDQSMAERLTMFALGLKTKSS